MAWKITEITKEYARASCQSCGCSPGCRHLNENSRFFEVSSFGPEGDPSLAKALKRRLPAGKGRKARLGVLEVPCVDICPKKGVVLIDTRHPDSWRIVREDADIDRLAEELIAP